MKQSVLTGVGVFAAGIVLVVFTHVHFFPVVDTVIWQSDADSAQRTAYHEMNDTTNALMVSGLYQYTVRDLWRQLFPTNVLSDEERQQIDDYVAQYEANQKDNQYTGLLAGKTS